MLDVRMKSGSHSLDAPKIDAPGKGRSRGLLPGPEGPARRHLLEAPYLDGIIDSCN